MKLAPKWDPMPIPDKCMCQNMKKDSLVGSRSAPIRTPPSKQIASTNQRLVSEFGAVPLRADLQAVSKHIRKRPYPCRIFFSEHVLYLTSEELGRMGPQ